MLHPSESQLMILNTLVYHETFDHILQETGFQRGVIRDDLIGLQHGNYIEVFENEDGQVGKKVKHFDNDHPELFYYRATKAGLDLMAMP